MDAKIMQMHSSLPPFFYSTQNGAFGTEKISQAYTNTDGGQLDAVSFSKSSKLLTLSKQTFSNALKSIRETNVSVDNAISDDYVQNIINLGKTVEKPDDGISDLQWGLTVQMGMEMGITDTDALAELTAEDLDRYINEFYKKPLGMKTVGYDILDENGNITKPKSYSSKEAYWADVFKTDSSGGFLKDAYGKPVRNSGFKQDMLVDEKLEKMNKSIVIEADAVVAPYEGKLINMPPSLLQNYALGLASGDMAALDYAKNATGTITGTFDSWLPDGFSKYTDAQKMQFYKDKLSFGFSLLKSSLLSGKTSSQAENSYMESIRSGDYVWKRI